MRQSESANTDRPVERSQPAQTIQSSQVSMTVGSRAMSPGPSRLRKREGTSRARTGRHRELLILRALGENGLPRHVLAVVAHLQRLPRTTSAAKQGAASQGARAWMYNAELCAAPLQP